MRIKKITCDFETGSKLSGNESGKPDSFGSDSATEAMIFSDQKLREVKSLILFLFFIFKAISSPSLPTPLPRHLRRLFFFTLREKFF